MVYSYKHWDGATAAKVKTGRFLRSTRFRSDCSNTGNRSFDASHDR